MILWRVVLVLVLFGTIQARRRSQRPLAHLSGTNPLSEIYPANTEITDFRVDGPFRRFTYLNGTLTAQISGTYYIYAQAFFEHYPGEPSEPRNHVAFAVNGVTVSVMQPGMGGFADYGSVNTGRIVHLLKGDYISLITINPSRIWITEDHSFFGAYRVSNIPRPSPQRRTDDHEQTGS